MERRHFESGPPQPPRPGSRHGDVSNKFSGNAHNVVQFGDLNGDLNLIPQQESRRTFPLLLFIALGVLVLLVAITFVYLNTRHRSTPQSTAAKPSIAATTSSAQPLLVSPTSVPIPRPIQEGTATIEVPDGKPAIVGAVKIAVQTVAFTSTNNGTANCGGGGSGKGGGECRVVAGHSKGSTTLGTVDFSIVTQELSCTASSVQDHESVVVAAPSGKWARVLVVSIGSNDAGDESEVKFDVSSGQYGPVPQSPKVCVPS